MFLDKFQRLHKIVVIPCVQPKPLEKWIRFGARRLILAQRHVEVNKLLPDRGNDRLQGHEGEGVNETEIGDIWRKRALLVYGW